MPRTTKLDAVHDVRLMLAQLLYASPLPLAEGTAPAPAEVRLHVRSTLHKLSQSACEQQIIAEYGAVPESAAARMRLALAAVASTYSGPFLGRTLFTRRRELSGLLEPAGLPSPYVPVEQRPAAWAEMARTLADTGMATADIADALAVAEATVLLLLAMDESGAQR
ncbi:hypothetical protein [Kitasatospora sp. HPMI-4]|uniref:hypothetical protein n=1 Tax=Kitasatospora sp. HPMI-4 TaxID=3448443 RepID=UPI003F1A4DEE